MGVVVKVNDVVNAYAEDSAYRFQEENPGIVYRGSHVDGEGRVVAEFSEEKEKSNGV